MEIFTPSLFGGLALGLCVWVFTYGLNRIWLGFWSILN